MDKYAEIRALLKRAEDRVFTIHFWKMDGTVRVLKALQGQAAGQHVLGTGGQMQAHRAQANPNLINLYDVEAEGFRAVNLDTTFEVWIDGQVFDIHDCHPIERQPL